MIYCYENKPYAVIIRDALLYPQGYAAVLAHMNLLRGEPSVTLCDIGGCMACSLENAVTVTVVNEPFVKLDLDADKYNVMIAAGLCLAGVALAV